MTRLRYILVLMYILETNGFHVETNILTNALNNLHKSGHNNSKCDVALRNMAIDATKMKAYALKMIDSTGKLPTGLFEMNTYQLGAFDECLEINYPEAKGKYCLASISLPMQLLSKLPLGIHGAENLFKSNGSLTNPIKILWGVCVPDVCTAQDLSSHFSKDVSFTNEHCQSLSEPQEFGSGDIAAIIFFSVLSVIIVFSTLFDLYLDKMNKVSSSKLLTAFSFLSNGRKLFAVTDNEDQLSCLSGIRAITIMWIVLFHMHTISAITPIANFLSLVKYMMSSDSMFVKTATVSVDTFFLVGGVVLVYSFMRGKKYMNFNFLSYYIHRYLRLTPPLAAVVLVQLTLLKYIGSGPIWPMNYESNTKDCEDYWWSTLLYVQNWVNPSNRCIGVSWYLSLDFQLFLLSPFILIPLKKRPKITLIVVVLLACATMFVSYYVAWEYKLNGLINDNMDDYTRLYYTVIQTRAAPWLFGIVTGYLIYQIKFTYKSIELNRFLVMFLWIASLAVMLLIVTQGNDLMNSERYNRSLNSIYMALVRPSWALAVAWIVFACALGYGGPINSFLSMSIFQIMARITYSIFLIHYSILTCVFHLQRTPPRFSNMLLYYFWAHFVVVCFVAVIWTLVFESPIAIIETLFKRKSTKPDNSNGTTHKISVVID